MRMHAPETNVKARVETFPGKGGGVWSELGAFREYDGRGRRWFSATTTLRFRPPL